MHTHSFNALVLTWSFRLLLFSGIARTHTHIYIYRCTHARAHTHTHTHTHTLTHTLHALVVARSFCLLFFPVPSPTPNWLHSRSQRFVTHSGISDRISHSHPAALRCNQFVWAGMSSLAFYSKVQFCNCSFCLMEEFQCLFFFFLPMACSRNNEFVEFHLLKPRFEQQTNKQRKNR